MSISSPLPLFFNTLSDRLATNGPAFLFDVDAGDRWSQSHSVIAAIHSVESYFREDVAESNQKPVLPTCISTGFRDAAIFDG